MNYETQHAYQKTLHAENKDYSQRMNHERLNTFKKKSTRLKKDLKKDYSTRLKKKTILHALKMT